MQNLVSVEILPGLAVACGNSGREACLSLRNEDGELSPKVQHHVALSQRHPENACHLGYLAVGCWVKRWTLVSEPAKKVLQPHLKRKQHYL